MSDIAPEATGLDLHGDTEIPRKKVLSWAMYDWALQPFNTVILTFVFTAMYLVTERFLDAADRYYLDGLRDARDALADYGGAAYQYASEAFDSARDSLLAPLTSGFGLVTTIAGVCIALIAPILGQWADATGKRKKWVFWSGLALLASMGALFFVQEDPRFFWLGVALIAAGTVLNQVNETNYNAMIVSVATPKSVGRVSGLGWGLGYSGGVVALILIAVLDQTGIAPLGADNGITFRLIAVGGVVWAFIFGWPLFKNVPAVPVEGRQRKGFFAAYGELFRTVREVFRTQRSTFWFLISSAVFRDGLSGVFAFGAIIGSAAFGFSMMEMLIFGIAANLVAGVATILVGKYDDRFGPRRVIIASLTILLLAGGSVVALHRLGSIVYWIGGLILCCTVGPAQSAARSYLARRIPVGHESEIFGLYATTGKAASFMAPAMWTTFIAVFGATIWGTLGIMLVVVTGLVLFVVLGRGDVVQKPVEQ
jgi:UMF1 family MFS transporter